MPFGPKGCCFPLWRLSESPRKNAISGPVLMTILTLWHSGHATDRVSFGSGVCAARWMRKGRPGRGRWFGRDSFHLVREEGRNLDVDELRFRTWRRGVAQGGEDVSKRTAKVLASILIVLSDGVVLSYQLSLALSKSPAIFHGPTGLSSRLQALCRPIAPYIL